jgi:alkylhydroperoxidase family enzyme
MARVMPAQVENETGAGDAQDRLESQTQAIFAHRPQSQQALVDLLMSFGETGGGTLPPRLMELLRLRIAFWNQCRSCMSLRYQPEMVSEDLVCSLERPEEAEHLSDAEKSALRYADLMAANHLAIDEATYEDLRLHFTEGEIVELGMYCATSVGFGRLAASWRLTDHLHDRFQGEQEQAFTPWGEGALR